jgi:hypothetical protein
MGEFSDRPISCVIWPFSELVAMPWVPSNYPGKRPQTVWGCGRIMYNVGDDDDDYYYYYYYYYFSYYYIDINIIKKPS